MKRLAMFFDGTWNTPGTDTNVFRLYQITKSSGDYRGNLWARSFKRVGEGDSPTQVRQLKYYHPGVGTTRGSHLLGGLFGYGLSKMIRDGLLWLSVHYHPGDEIYLFGFSRGAYTARSLAGLIRKCGIPKSSENGLVDTAYKFYRNRQWDVDGMEATAFRKTYSWPLAKIKFVGVWDTVGALGIPVHGVYFSEDWYTFHDTKLSGWIEHAYHALALDEHRPDFAATLWTPKDELPDPKQIVEQRWFPGAHADVGGGYKDGSLYKLALHWIQEKAKGCGLEFSVNVGFDREAHLSKMHDTLKGFPWSLYAKLPWIYRHYRPRYMGINETVDDSIIERIKDPRGKDGDGQPYRPPAIP